MGYRRGVLSNRIVSWNNYDGGLRKNHFRQTYLPTRTPLAFPELAVRWKWTVDLSGDVNEKKSAPSTSDHHVDAHPTTNEGQRNESSTAQPQNASSNSKVPQPVTNILTYHGWDVLDTSVAAPSMREVAEWDPVQKKIIKKVRLVTEDETQKAERRALRQKTKESQVLAKKDPLHKSSRMCPICRKSFHGHNQMTSHLISRSKCFSALDPSVGERLLEFQTRKRSKTERRRLFRKAFNKKKEEEKAERRRKREQREATQQNLLTRPSSELDTDGSTGVAEAPTPTVASTDDESDEDLNSDDSDHEEVESEARILEQP